MQVNTRWTPELAKIWHVAPTTARLWVRDNGCVNVHVAAWILKQKIAESGSLFGGIATYHSATRGVGYNYATKVIAVMERKGLIRNDEASAPSPSTTRYAER